MPLFYSRDLPEFTWATKPAAAAFRGGAIITDVGVNGSMWNSNGTIWSPLSNLISLLSGGVPVYLPSSGTIGNNGALTLTTALPLTFPHAYLYFPENAISAGSAAGKYYCIMSSTTVGTIYNNTYTSGTPSIPTSPTAFVTTGPGVYVQTTAASISLLSTPILGGSLGKNGSIEPRCRFSINSSAGTKTFGFMLGGVSIASANGTTSVSYEFQQKINNNGSEAVQYSNSTAVINGVSGIAPVNLGINTASDTTFDTYASLAVATDFCGVTQYLLKMMSAF